MAKSSAADRRIRNLQKFIDQLTDIAKTDELVKPRLKAALTQMRNLQAAKPATT